MKWTKSGVVGALAVCAALLAGCGGNGQSEERAMGAAFDRIDVETANVERGYQPDQAVLRGLTRRYVATVLKYKDVLGTDGAKERLATKAEELKPWCLPCAQTLLQERAKY